MNKLLAAFAVVLSGAAIWLAAGGETFERVDAGGHPVRILREGRGGPTVVFEAGAGGSLESWVRIQPEVARFTSTIAYDRAGNGLSPRGRAAREGRQIARELHQALLSAHASPPYLLVGHSLGGPFIRVFAGMYPDEVAGMILVDPTQEELIAWSKARNTNSVAPEKHRWYDEVDCAPETFAQAHESMVPPGIPVALICGMGPRTIPEFVPQEVREDLRHDHDVLYPAKLKFHREWLEKIPDGQLIVTENSGHGIPYEEPELVIKTIRAMVEQIRAGVARAATGKPN